MPPALLSKSLATMPSAAATTGVPCGAMMSMASCTRFSPRAWVKVSTSWPATMPCTGISNAAGRSVGVAGAVALAAPTAGSLPCGSTMMRAGGSVDAGTDAGVALGAGRADAGAVFAFAACAASRCIQ